MSSDFRSPIEEAFEQNGVSRHRLDFIGGLPPAEHLRVYHKVDFCLDTFPYNGMTLTRESLWMGVPVLTLAGRSYVREWD